MNRVLSLIFNYFIELLEAEVRTCSVRSLTSFKLKQDLMLLLQSCRCASVLSRDFYCNSGKLFLVLITKDLNKQFDPECPLQYTIILACPSYAKLKCDISGSHSYRHI